MVGEEGGCNVGDLRLPSSVITLVRLASGDDTAGCCDGTSASSLSTALLVIDGAPEGPSEVDGRGLGSALCPLEPGILFLIEPLKDLADSRVSVLLKDG